MRTALARIPFLKDAAPEALAAAAEEARWFSLPGGWPLFEAGEDSNAVYFALTGSLGAFEIGPDGERRLRGYIRAGEPVGEMALISGEPHSASVYAVRDCEMAAFSREAFNRLVDAHPRLMQSLAKLMLARARERNAQLRSRAEPRIFTLISTSPTIDLKLRAQALKEALARIGKRCVVLSEESAGDMLSLWLDALEREYDAVLLITPIADTLWFRTCLRQCDRIWMLARNDARPSTPLLPDDPSPARQFRHVDLIMLQFAGVTTAARTEEWRLACGAARMFHWSNIDAADSDRLARVIAGQAVGLVLSGGGARAYAHIGVIRALREARVPIDFVGGTSMGAIVGACLAMGWNDDEIEQRIRAAFVESNPLGDYVLPVVSLSRGRRVEERLREHFGETQIEDLRTSFFCCSTDLSGGTVRVHETGLLRYALRASISLPGILPPITPPEGGLLVDGAVLKNFPVDVMRGLHRGSIIGVDVARRGTIRVSDFKDPPNFFGWVSTRGFQSAPPIASLLMRTATLTVDPWQGRDRTDLLVTPEAAGVDLRDWKKYDAAVASGYESAVAALKTQPLIGKPKPEGVRADIPEFEAAE
jgi:NTE family protein